MQHEPRGADGTLDPDAGEEELDLDNVVPTVGYHYIPLIALGGSAGSIDAIQRFLQATPAQPGMAFIVVLHLSPDHSSSLSSVLQLATRMPVTEARDGQEVLPNNVYVIPPAKQLSLLDGHLRLTELPRERGKRVTVDLFFRSLADTRGPHAVGIVFSGLDGDGALGIKRIKERGGLTIAQDPDEAEHPSMPETAIATNMVDWVLRASEIPARLIEYQERERRIELPPEDGPNPASPGPPNVSREEAVLREVLTFLKARTGRDFSYYKRGTIVRRVARRMQVNQVDSLEEYLAYLRMHAGEAGALLQDLLISVTNFFRDRECFSALEQHVPELFRDKAATDTIRVWVPACATGEEAYSIAILLSEYAQTLEAPPALHIFATDLDEQVLSEARNGVYPLAIEADVSPERLRRFFVREPKGYRVRQELREILLFAVHDLLKDSPFSRLDLVSCRNLLIYLNRAAQKRALGIFHFALQAEGQLFLGSSESADEASGLFRPLDKRHHLYRTRGGARASLQVPAGPSSLARLLAARSPNAVLSLARKQARQSLATATSPAPSAPERTHWGEVHLRLIERAAPPSLLVDSNDDILHLSQGAGAFLELNSGEPSMNLFSAVHPGLRAELRAALFRARENNGSSMARAIPVLQNGQNLAVDIQVSPSLEATPECWLVTLDAKQVSSEASQFGPPSSVLVRELELELEQTKQVLRELTQQQDVSTEELRASNEELQAMNEELRSATEELETGREELQSINEEVLTVNQELKGKVDELGQTNSHLHNLMGATAIPMVFLDRALRIMRFTPPAAELFSLMPGDVGRPLAHLSHSLNYAELLSDASQVLEQLGPLEREVSDSRGRIYLARLLPYTLNEERVGGVVLTFINVTELHAAQAALRGVQQELEERVKARTAELGVVNEALRAEVATHERVERARQELQSRLVNAQEEERSRISRELHDEVGQQLTALMLALKALESEPAFEGMPSKLREMRSIAEQIGRDIHQLASELRPMALDELGLARALAGYLDVWADRSGIAVDFFCAVAEGARLPRPIETKLYRIVQEAMNNVLKHASAKAVGVSIERGAEHIIAIIEDDGVGFDMDAVPGIEEAHLGIAGMRERAALAGGELTIESEPGRGTTVRARLPVPPHEH